MEKYIEKLKLSAKPAELSELTVNKENETLQTENPLVVCCITLGKEPHLGHLFLLSIAEQTKSALGGDLPVVLINNNTGPRAAGAVVSMAEAWGLSLPEAVELMSAGTFPVSEVVEKYRKRGEDVANIRTVNELIRSNGVDVFSVVAQETEQVLKQAGFGVEIASEAELQLISGDQVHKLNTTWSGSGFLPFVQGGRVVTIQKSGDLTATGALFVATQTLIDATMADLAVLVDDEAGVGDTAFVLTEKEGQEKGVQIFGAGVSFAGKIASGTGGEAMTIKKVLEEFGKHRPAEKLKQATVYLTLTKPMLREENMLSKRGHIFDFVNNEEVITALVESADACDLFVEQMAGEMENLATKVGENTVVKNKKTQKFANHLAHKAAAMLMGEPARVLAESKRVVDGVRQNYYFNTLKGMRKFMADLETISADDFVQVGLMIECCLIRLGL